MTIDSSSSGTVSWDWKAEGIHHDVLVLPSGNVLTCIHYNKTAEEARALGRRDVPANATGNFMLVDSVVEVKPTGATTGPAASIFPRTHRETRSSFRRSTTRRRPRSSGRAC